MKISNQSHEKDGDYFQKARDLYRKALELPQPNIKLPNLLNSYNVKGLKNNIFLWMNMLLLEILCWESKSNSIDSFLALLNDAINSLEISSRNMLWLE